MEHCCHCRRLHAIAFVHFANPRFFSDRDEWPSGVLREMKRRQSNREYGDFLSSRGTCIDLVHLQRARADWQDWRAKNTDKKFEIASKQSK